MSSPVAQPLGPLRHVARPPRTQRDAQPQLGQRGAVPGRVRPHVDGAQHGAVLVEQPPGPDRGAGTSQVARVVAARGSRRTSRGRAASPVRRPRAEAASRRCAAASACCAAAQQGRGQDAGVEGGRRPARGRQRPRHLEGCADVRGSGAPVRAGRTQHQEPGERGPLRPVLAAEPAPPAGRAAARPRRRRRAGRPRRGPAGPGAASCRGGRGRTPRRPAPPPPRLADQPHREQQIGPVDQQLAQAAVLLADALLRGVGVGERGRGLAAQAEHERQVGLGESHLQRQRLLPREPLRQAQVRLAGANSCRKAWASPRFQITRRTQNASSAARSTGSASR